MRELVFDCMKLYPRSFVKERQKFLFKVQDDLKTATPPVYIEAGMITPNYFQKIRSEILKDLTCTRKIPQKISPILEKIDNENSVAIHIRRGDYLSAKVNNKYPIYGMKYVDEAINILERLESNLTYFIFTDDPKWAKNNIKVDQEITIVSRKSILPWLDMELMSKCKHNIISNSTFSWWAAYRNLNPNKKIICPKKWRNDRKDISDLILSDWIAI